jgi:hypothetical protein
MEGWPVIRQQTIRRLGRDVVTRILAKQLKSFPVAYTNSRRADFKLVLCSIQKELSTPWGILSPVPIQAFCVPFSRRFPLIADQTYPSEFMFPWNSLPQMNHLAFVKVIAQN